MADFSFGFIRDAVEAGKEARANLYTGPVVETPFEFLGNDFTDFVLNSDRKAILSGNNLDFIWGQKWGNSQTRVAK